MDEKTQLKLLGIVSFCVLMENNGGIIGKAPNYIFEKFAMVNSPVYIYSALDSFNQRKVITWGEYWGVNFEKLIEQMGKDYYDIPATEFRKKYFWNGQ